MRKLILICWLFLPLLSVAQASFPTYEAVVHYCFSNYTGAGVPVVRLIKDPSGYKAVFSGEQSPVLVWSPERKWLPMLPASKSTTASEFPQIVFDSTEVRRYVDLHLRQNALAQSEADRLPYYGYRGYYKDVIRVLEPAINQLSDADLHSLARAYSIAASSLLHDNSRFADSTDLFQLPPGRGKLTEQQVQRYLLAHQKAVDAYRQLLLRNPDFLTPVGTVRVKYAHEIMDGYLQMRYFQGEATAKQLLQAGIYEPELLTIPRNILLSSPPNAVLITYGDGDTYTLLYLQAVEQIRLDVRVVNTALLVVPRYCQEVYDGAYNQPPLNTFLPPVFFQKLVVLEQTTSSPTTVESARVFIENLARFPLEKTGFGYELASCPIPILEMPPAPAEQLLPANKSILARWKPKAKYITLESVVPVDLIVANNWRIPICFSPACAATVLAPWQGHLVLEGMVFRLVPHQLPALNWENTPIHLERSVQLFQAVFRFPNLQRLLRDEELPFYQYWVLAHLQVVRGLIKVNQLEEAVRMADVLEHAFTEKMAPRGFLWIPLVEQYAQCGKTATAQYLASQILDNFSKGRLNGYEMQGKAEGIEKLNALARKYQFSMK